jgi:uncharacterized membrane protein
LLVTSRTNLLPLLTLILASCFYTKKKSHVFIFAASLCFVILWTIIALKTTVDTRTKIGESTSNIALFYIEHPLALFNVLKSTILNLGIVHGYVESFLGNLGWLDTRLGTKSYILLFSCIFSIGFLSFSIKELKAEWIPRIIVLFCSLMSIFLVFFALLVTWTPHPATYILGIQGRYFLIPSIMIAYAFSSKKLNYDGVKDKIIFMLLICMATFVITELPLVIRNRYY